MKTAKILLQDVKIINNSSILTIFWTILCLFSIIKVLNFINKQREKNNFTTEKKL